MVLLLLLACRVKEQSDECTRAGNKTVVCQKRVFELVCSEVSVLGFGKAQKTR